MFLKRLPALAAGAGLGFALIGGMAAADSISPLTYSNDDLAVGESVTIEKTVVISEGGPSDALIDVHFLIDTSGSMGGEVSAAKLAATSLFNGLNEDFGNVAASVGVFSEGASLTDPDIRGRAIIGDLTTNVTTFQDNVDLVTLGNPDGGGDFPESGYTGIALAGDNLSWRPGSNRFMFVFTDASAKGDLAGAQAAIANNDINIVTLAYRNFASVDGSYGAPLGGEVFNSTTSVADIIADVTAGIAAGFANYDEVTVSDLGNGLPEIQVSTVCKTADIGACNGAVAEGDYDRSVERTFTFDVTFTRLAAGDKSFSTFALVDGGIVATEIDTFGGDVSAVPLPAAGWMLLAGFGGLVAASRRKKAA